MIAAALKLFEFLADHLTPVAFIVVFGFLVLAFWYNRKEIRALIGRICPIPLPAEQQTVGQRNAVEVPATPKSPVVPESGVARDLAEQIINHAPGSSPEERIRTLATDLANKSLRLEFETTYRSIYGSQLEALQAIRRAGPLALAEFHAMHVERAKQKYGDQIPVRTDFETWLSFLTRRAFPYVVVESGVARLTPAGDEFLLYLTGQNMTFDRMF